MRFDPIAWAKTHKPQAGLAAGAVGAVGIGLYRRRARASGAMTSKDGVPVDATTAASVQPYSDTAGGIPFDPSAFNFDPGNYLGQISQQLSTTNARLGTADTKLGTIAKNTAPKKKPATGGKKTPKRHPTPKPRRKQTKPKFPKRPGPIGPKR